MGKVLRFDEFLNEATINGVASKITSSTKKVELLEYKWWSR